MNKSVVIVAGGKGSRMGTDIPKQFLSLCGRPVLMHTIEAFYRFDLHIQVVLVLPLDQQDYWKELCEKYRFDLPVEIISGGETRFHSVRNGLSLVPEDVMVGIHDGVRPLVSGEVLAACYESAERNQGAFPVVPVIDSLRRMTPEGSVMVDRSEYFAVQTPQVFHSNLIQKAYRQPYSDRFTDDVSVLESIGGKAVEVPGSPENIKITNILDLDLAERLIMKKNG
ncbi:MAG: 2-C-methyl-D-erythritol 4-phosphate cytidylyltransferase [Dysgonamonadaceae bacterium]|jgi:2-C-methyl-D-erythritol 4-phosphate cytidylyltransferase|nr:2-C-methyl-D-erythritol 4-phosphate cytidylyltransferase [Dysgonamonadaceae bacterium]